MGKMRTLLMEDMARISHTVTVIGTGMAYGYLDIGAGNESLLQLALAGMMVRNDENRKKQAEAYPRNPWLEAACGR